MINKMITAACLLALLSAPVFAGSAYLKIEGIRGGSTDPGRAEYINVLGIKNGLTKAANADPIVVTVVLDSSYSELIKSALTGSKIPRASLEMTNDSGTTTTKITLSNVSIIQAEYNFDKAKQTVPAVDITIGFLEAIYEVFGVDPKYPDRPAPSAKYEWNNVTKTGK